MKKIETATDIDVDTKVETAWVIQRDDGLFANNKHRFVNNIIASKLFRIERFAEIEIEHNCFELQNCKSVKVEIKVVEDAKD